MEYIVTVKVEGTKELTEELGQLSINVVIKEDVGNKIKDVLNVLFPIQLTRDMTGEEIVAMKNKVLSEVRREFLKVKRARSQANSAALRQALEDLQQDIDTMVNGRGGGGMAVGIAPKESPPSAPSISVVGLPFKPTAKLLKYPSGVK